jgi:hypothetical protein
MATPVPNSYKDPYWVELSANTERKLGLPDGMLRSVLLYGERSNNDQVSSADARTPYQIIPSARNLAIKAYGIDPYLSPENAAEVAGRFLKDSLDRNKGDKSRAFAEYHGGTDPKNWGPITQSYITRTMGGLSELTGQPTTTQAPAPTTTRQLQHHRHHQVSRHPLLKAAQLAHLRERNRHLVKRLCQTMLLPIFIRLTQLARCHHKKPKSLRLMCVVARSCCPVVRLCKAVQYKAQDQH